MTETLSISSRCPNCNDSRVVKFLRSELSSMLHTGRRIECYCGSCNKVWPLTEVERANLQRDLDSVETK